MIRRTDHTQGSAAAQHASHLLEFLKHPSLALDHAEWAWNNVKKPETKAFWVEVINELKNKTAAT